MSAWLSVIGIGEDGLAGLGAAPRSLIEAAEVLVGGKRHHALLPDHTAERLGWRFPLEPLMAELEARRGKRVVVLASGDPFCYGIAATLARHLPLAEMRVLPAPSAFALARARLGWPAHTVQCLTLHGRPLEIVAGWLLAGQRLLLLSHDGATPAKLAALLAAHGFGPSRMVVLEHMGGEKERIVETTAGEWGEAGAADLNTIALLCRSEPGVPSRPRVPGLPDEAFRHDGLITKREVRAASLAALGPLPGARLIDVGAGAGSIAIEWLRAAANASAVAIERDAARAATIAENAAALGVPNLDIVTGEAPAALSHLGPADAVFLGGGLTAPGMIEACLAPLVSGGRLVANAVTVEGEVVLLDAWRAHGGELRRLAISRAEALAGVTAWRALAPVTQWAMVVP